MTGNRSSAIGDTPENVSRKKRPRAVGQNQNLSVSINKEMDVDFFYFCQGKRTHNFHMYTHINIFVSLNRVLTLLENNNNNNQKEHGHKQGGMKKRVSQLNVILCQVEKERRRTEGSLSSCVFRVTSEKNCLYTDKTPRHFHRLSRLDPLNTKQPKHVGQEEKEKLLLPYLYMLYYVYLVKIKLDVYKYS